MSTPLICFYTPAHPDRPFARSESADLITDLLIEVGLLLALQAQPLGCAWRPP